MTSTFKLPILLLLFPLALLMGCEPKETVPTPAVAKITPVEGPPGTLITVEGSGLTDLQKVTFGTENAPFNPVFNTDGALLIRVPANAKFGAQTVTLYNKGGDATKTTLSFKVLQPAPTLEKFAPTEAAVGDTITLTGKIFDNVTTVNFGTVPSKILSASPTTIQVIVPDKVEKAPIEVVTPGGSAKSSLDFSPKGTGLYVFDEAIIGDWQSWSWAKVAIGDTEKAQKGTKSIKVTYAGWAAFWLNNPTPIDISKFGTLKFSVFGGEGTKDKTVRVSYRDNDVADAEKGKGVVIKIKPGVWNEYVLPLKDLGAASKLKAILFQEFSGEDVQPVWYDEIKLQ